jgi:hypothetical protein
MYSIHILELKNKRLALEVIAQMKYNPIMALKSKIQQLIGLDALERNIKTARNKT